MQQELRHQIIGDRYRAADSQFIRNLALGLDLMFTVLVDLQNLLCIGEELAAFIRKVNLLAQPVEYSAIQLPFKRLDTGRHCRLGDVEYICGFVEASVVVDVDKGFNVLNVQA